jgi:hypothetical protein
MLALTGEDHEFPEVTGGGIAVVGRGRERRQDHGRQREAGSLNAACSGPLRHARANTSDR